MWMIVLSTKQLCIKNHRWIQNHKKYFLKKITFYKKCYSNYIFKIRQKNDDQNAYEIMLRLSLASRQCEAHRNEHFLKRVRLLVLVVVRCLLFEAALILWHSATDITIWLVLLFVNLCIHFIYKLFWITFRIRLMQSTYVHKILVRRAGED